MADLLPPIPYDRPQTSFEWIDWYTKLNLLINSGAQHNNLQGLQGGQSGQYYHLSLADYNAIKNIVDSSPLPVGSYYFSDNNDDPAVTLGYGTWQLMPFTLMLYQSNLP